MRDAAEATSGELGSVIPSSPSPCNPNVRRNVADLEPPREEEGEKMTPDSQEGHAVVGAQQDEMHQIEDQQEDGQHGRLPQGLEFHDNDGAHQAPTALEQSTAACRPACSHQEEDGRHQQQQPMDMIGRKAPSPPRPMQQRQRTVSRYEKDPLNIGVPFPVLARLPPAVASAAFDNDNTEEDGAFAAIRNVMEASRRDQETTEATERKLAQDTNHSNHSCNAEDGVEKVDRSVAYASAVQPCGMQVEDGSSLFESQESFGIPGSYAIGGPNWTEDNQPSATAPEDFEHSTDVEQGSTAFELTVNGRSTSQCSNTTSTLFPSMTSAASDSSYLVEATLVPDEDDKDDDDLVLAEEAESTLKFSALCVVVSFCVMAIIIVGVMLAIAAVFQLKTGNVEYTAIERNRPGPTLSPTMPPSLPALSSSSTSMDTMETVPTLQRVKETGILRCGLEAEVQSFFEYATTNGHLNQNTTNLTLPASKFHHHYCAAIAAAVLGEEANFELVGVPQKSKYYFLANRSIDLLFSRTPVNMQQDVYEDAAHDGLAYSMPYLHTCFGFAGVPFYVNCTDANLKTYGECSDIRICANENTFFADHILSSVPQQNLVLVTTSEDALSNFLMGQCNVVATESTDAIQAFLRAFGYTKELAGSQKHHTHYRGALNSLDSDPEWADFLNAVTMALLAADSLGITKETADEIGQTALFGVDYQDMFINAIKAGGNFGEIYDLPVPWTGRNMPNNGSSGMLASPSLGQESFGSPRQDGILSAILKRGILSCGIRGGRPGFALYNVNRSEWEGLDVSFCKLLAAGLFSDSDVAIDFHDLSDAHGFEALHSGVVDVLAGAVWTLETDMREPVTKVGFSFTQPYFYGPVNDKRFDENLCLATRQDDPEWSAFVYWAAQAVVYAEENNILMETSNEMPLIEVFGPDLHRLFRDVVNCVGNYGELYHRHISPILPRGGRNMLTVGEEPLRYIPPGF